MNLLAELDDVQSEEPSTCGNGRVHIVLPSYSTVVWPGSCQVIHTHVQSSDMLLTIRHIWSPQDSMKVICWF